VNGGKKEPVSKGQCPDGREEKFQGKRRTTKGSWGGNSYRLFIIHTRRESSEGRGGKRLSRKTVGSGPEGGTLHAHDPHLAKRVFLSAWVNVVYGGSRRGGGTGIYGRGRFSAVSNIGQQRGGYQGQSDHCIEGDFTE